MCLSLIHIQVQFLGPFLQVSMAEQLRTGVPWQVTLAQIAYESGWGQKEMYDEDVYKRQAYETAVEEKYRFFSFGDAMFIVDKNA